MKEHIRMDGINVFPKEAKILDDLMSKEKIKSKSDAYRFALNTYVRSIDMINEFKNVKAEVKELQNQVQVNNYLLQEALAEIKKLTRV